MIKFGKRRILTDRELTERAKEQYNDGLREGKDRINNLKSQNEALNKKVERLNRKIDDLQEYHRDEKTRLQSKIDVLAQERRDYNELIERQIELDDLENRLEAQKSVLDSRVDELDKRESRIGNKEQGQYKEGYADGVADGVRRIHEVTAQDRKDAMKVAMVAASSHTPVANMREINNELRLAKGSTDSED